MADRVGLSNQKLELVRRLIDATCVKVCIFDSAMDKLHGHAVFEQILFSFEVI